MKSTDRNRHDMTTGQQLCLYAIRKLCPEADGASIKQYIEEITERPRDKVVIYTCIDIMVKYGWLESSLELEPRPIRGGRRRTFYTITELGARELLRTEKELDAARAA